MTSTTLSPIATIKKQARQRTFLTHEIKLALEDYYILEAYPSQEKMQSIADQLTGITAKNVKLWFQNRRAKERHENPNSSLRRCKRNKSSGDSSPSKDQLSEQSPYDGDCASGSSTSESDSPAELPQLPIDFDFALLYEANAQSQTASALSDSVAPFCSMPVAECESLLLLAARVGNHPLLQLLLQTGVDVNTRDATSGTSALIESVVYGSYEDICALLDAGASTEVADNFGRRPLHVAAQFDRKEIVEVLLANSTMVDSVDQGGFTPLQVAVAMGNIECVALLLAAGACTTTVTSDGQTLADLVHLCQSPNADLIIGLLNTYTITNMFLPVSDQTISFDEFLDAK